MKRGTPKHPKLDNLCEVLNIRRPLAVGFLELLWHFTAEFAPQGDVGKYTYKRIEAAVEWGGGVSGGRREKPGALMTALCDTGWLDFVGACEVSADGFVTPCSVSEDGVEPAWERRTPGVEPAWKRRTPGLDVSWTGPPRVLVHDWEAHADDATARKLARAGLPFLRLARKVTGDIPVSDGNLSGSRARVATPKPKPMPVPPPEPGRADTHTVSALPDGECASPPPPAAPAADLEAPAAPVNGTAACVSPADRFPTWFDGFRGRKADPDGACRQWISVITPETVEAAFACRDRYNSSDEVARNIRMEAKKFIQVQAAGGWRGDWTKTSRQSSRSQVTQNVAANLKELRKHGR
jgi:hypothetical protein